MIFLLIYFAEEVPTISIIAFRRLLLLRDFLAWNRTRIELISLALLIDNYGT